MQIFKVFLVGLFSDPWSIFEGPGSRKGSRKITKMEAEASLEAPSGKCKKHGRGYVFSTPGHVGESPGGDFFQSGSPAPFWKDLGEHFGRFFEIFVIFGGPFGLHFRPKYTIFWGTKF